MAALYYDKDCRHGGPAANDPKAQEILDLLPLLCLDIGLHASPFNPASLRDSIEEHAVLGGGAAPSIVLALAVDAFYQDDAKNSRMFLRLAVSLAAMAKAGRSTSLGRASQSPEAKLLRNCVDEAEASDDKLREALKARALCHCFGRPAASLEDGTWRREKGAGTACFRKGEWHLAAEKFIEAAELLQRSIEAQLEKDQGIDRILYGKCLGPSLTELRALGVEIAKLEANVSLCLLKSGNATLALSAATEAVKACPGLAKAHARRGAALMAMRRYGDAAEAFAEAARCAGRDGDAAEYEALRRRAEMGER